MIGVWFNPNKNCFYAKYVKGAYFFPHYVVGSVNSFDHELIALFAIEGHKLISCKSVDDYFKQKKKLSQPIIKRMKIKVLNYIIKRLERSVRNEQR